MMCLDEYIKQCACTCHKFNENSVCCSCNCDFEKLVKNPPHCVTPEMLSQQNSKSVVGKKE